MLHDQVLHHRVLHSGGCSRRCGAGSVKGSVRATLIVFREHSTAAWMASLFRREKARTGAVR